LCVAIRKRKYQGKEESQAIPGLSRNEQFLANSRCEYSKNDQEPHSDQYKAKAMEQVKEKAACVVNEKDWCGELGPSSKMQGDNAMMMLKPRHANLSPNSQHSFDFEDIKDRIRSGLSKCMSHSSAHLKDEVRFLATCMLSMILMVYRARGLRSSLLAGLLDWFQGRSWYL
jgi:hypothetical protein